MGLPVWSTIAYGEQDAKTPTIKQDPTASRRSPIRRRQRDLAAQRRSAVERGFPSSRTQNWPAYPSPPIPAAPSASANNVADASALRNALSRARNTVVRGMRRSEEVTEAYSEAIDNGSPGELNSLQMAMQAGTDLSTTIDAALNEILAVEQLLESGQITPDAVRHGILLLSSIIYRVEQTVHRIDVHEDNAVAARGSVVARPRVVSRREDPWVEMPPARSDRLQSAPLRPLAVPTPPPAQASVGQAGGLGDRTRSASPDQDAAAWDTMQVTIEPDANLPSADSSFTSAAAAASFSAISDHASTLGSGSRGSSSTNLTVPSNDENPCDDMDETLVLWADQIPPREAERYNDRHIDALRDRYPRARPSVPSDPAPPPAPAMRTYGAWRTFLGPDGAPVPAGGTGLGVIPRSQSPLPLSVAAPGGHPRLRTVDQMNSSWIESANRPTPANRRSPTQPERRRGIYPSFEAQPSRRYSRVGRSRRRDTRSPTQTEQEPPSRDPLAHPDLVHMRNTLMHMADGGEIPPQQFWASAGLTPIIAQGGELSGIRLLGDTMESASE